MRFYLGTHQVGWLATLSASLFVSRRRLVTRKRLPRALRPWALDSGGFSELALASTWTLSAGEYVCEVRRYSSEIGRLEWAAIQDWMCEPGMLRRTGLSIAEHQVRTISSYEELLQLAPGLPWVPVLQGGRCAITCATWSSTISEAMICGRSHSSASVPYVADRAHARRWRSCLILPARDCDCTASA